MRSILLAVAVAPIVLSACTTDTVLRPEGVTTFAGNAIAANTAMQIVDPWPRGVQETRLRVPAERAAAADTASDASDVTTSSTKQ